MNKRSRDKVTSSKVRRLHPRLDFYLPQPLLEALRRFVQETEPHPTLTAVINTALEHYLKSQSFWPPREKTSKT